MDIIIVGQGEYRHTRSPNVLDSGGLGPCIAVAALSARAGYMAHCYSVGMSILPQLQPLFDDLRKITSPLEFYLAGGSTYGLPRRMHEELERNRIIAIEEIVKRYPDATLDVRWETENLLLDIGGRKAEFD